MTQSRTSQQIVAMGGGHGLHASLTALRRITDQLTAVVTVADDGGSSGRLRDEFDVLPPGDLRMALAALCGDDEWGRTWESLVQHRFGGTGEMREHAVGNLLIVGLWELLGDPVQALDLVGQLLRAEGRVLPMCAQGLLITAGVQGLDPADPASVCEIRGQAQVATTPGRIVRVSLEPSTARACPESLAAVAEADWLVLGPGSWVTSVLPHLLLDELREAIVARSDRLIITLNVGRQDLEVSGFSLADQLEALPRLAPGLGVHTVLVDADAVRGEDRLESVVRSMGGELVVRPIAMADDPARHDPDALAGALAEIVG